MRHKFVAPSVALLSILPEAQGNAGGNSRLRFETALGSLYEAQAGVQLAVAWGYVTQAVANELLQVMNRLGGRVFGLLRCH